MKKCRFGIFYGEKTKVKIFESTNHLQKNDEVDIISAYNIEFLGRFLL